MNIFMDAASFLLWVTLVKAYYRDFSFKESLKPSAWLCVFYADMCETPRKPPIQSRRQEVVPT